MTRRYKGYEPVGPFSAPPEVVHDQKSSVQPAGVSVLQRGLITVELSHFAALYKQRDQFRSVLQRIADRNFPSHCTYAQDILDHWSSLAREAIKGD